MLNESKLRKEPQYPVEVNAPRYLSHSSASIFFECGEQYRLRRLYRFPETHTWFSTLAGRALHEATEAIDRDEFAGMEPEFALMMHRDSFAEKFQAEIARERAAGIEVKASGNKRVTLSEAGGPDKRDEGWWMHFAPLFLDKWQAWKAQSGLSLATDDDGNPGIELDLHCEVEGVTLTGMIDRLYVDKFGQYTVLDIKTGMAPGSNFQPLLYALLCREALGVTPAFCNYWRPMGKLRNASGDLEESTTGALSRTVEVTERDLEAVLHAYKLAYRAIESGMFIPNPDGADCRNCSVSELCRYQSGSLAWQVPGVSEVIPRHTDLTPSA